MIPEAALTQGLCQVQWPARLEVLCSDPLFLLDGGHNLQCIQAVCQALDALLQGQKIICLFGVMRDKEYPTMLQALAPYVCAFVGVQPSNARALPLEALGRALAKDGDSLYALRFYPSRRTYGIVAIRNTKSPYMRLGVSIYGRRHSPNNIRGERTCKF